MKLSNLIIKIPKNLIKKKPPIIKDKAKLMIINKKNFKIKHDKLKNLIKYFNKNDVIIRNNTKALPYEITGKKEKTKANIKIFLLKEINKKKNIWDTLVKPARKVRIGNKIYFKYKKNNKYLILEIIDNTTSRGRIIKFINKKDNKVIKKRIENITKIKLANYLIKKKKNYNIKNYQNIYAKKKGSIIFPTNGIHFSKNLFLKLLLKNIKITDITLHNNYFNSKKINIEDLSKYKINSEELIINKKNCKIINKALKNKKKICCIGVDTLNGIENSINSKNLLKKYNGYINKFIYSPFKFNIINSLISTFYYPKTIQFIILSTFCGYNNIKKIYEEAINKKYNFLSYGDLMLIK
ncbi:MAG: S-adenosylmethionine:tRNA ribosyltransferase-isomerase [Candidatus Shikimatogenerans bostrichidophilus]|nr:MAG: S-adenosylmethionine:tRNA ribosyltransferase-isomerase [Candidatus Shikimatogenerans bostrichidophilus]